MLSLKKLKKSLESLLKTDDNDHTKHLHDALDQALDNPSPTINAWIADKISDPRVRPDHLTRAIERPGYASRTAREAFQNPNITTEHVNFGLSHPSREIQQTTFTHAPLTEEQVSKEWDHSRNQEWGHKHNIALGLFNNPRAKIPSKVFDFIRNENPEPKLIHTSMQHADTPVEHARWGLHPTNSFHVNKVALSHPGLESKDLDLPLKSHSAEVRTAAASHPNISKDQLLNVIKNDQKVNVIHAALDNPRVDRDVVKEILTKPVLSIGPREIDKLVNHPSMDQEIFEDALKNQLPGSDKNALMLYGKRFINGNHIHDLINKDEAETLQSIEPKDSRVTPEHVHKAFYSLNTRPDTKRWALNSNHVTEQMLTDSLAATPDDVGYGTAEDAIRNKNLTPKHLSIALEHPKLNVQFVAARHPNLSTENIDQALGNEHYVIRRDAIKNANATEEQIKRALKDDDKEVVAAAKEKPIGQMLHLEQNPDKHQVKVKFDTGKLRQIRDYIDEKGGTVSKKDIEGLGYNLQSLGLNTQLDHKGNLSSQKVKDIIDSKPEHKFGYSFEKWDGPQRHSNKDSNVFQLNLTHDQYKELNDRGLLSTFQKVQQLSKQSSHPVKDHTIGWVRYTKSKDGTHLDEIQSDLGQGLVKQLKGMKEDNPNIDIDPEKVNEINHVIFKGKHPSELIHESFLQAMRDRGNEGKDIHIWGKEPKAALAGMREDEQLPAHMIEGYEKIPKKLGYQESKYGELKTQRNRQLHGAQTWKHKLRKSMPHKDGKFHASMVAVFVGPEMLFIRRDDSGLLTRPGGHAEPGEDALSAAVRELNEEVGIVASPEQLKFVGSKETPRHGGGTTVVSVFKLDLPSKPELDYSKDPDQEASSCVWSQPSLIKESEMHHKPDVVVELLKPKSLKQLKKSVEDLEKGLNGDWQKEGYTFTHDVFKDSKKDEHHISAFDLAGNIAGHYEFNRHYHKPDSLFIQESETAPAHQRKGIASEAYRIAEEKSGAKITPDVQTKDAEALWSNPNRKFGKSENKPNNGWLVKIEGEEGYHPLKDIKDLGYNQGNNYVLHDGREFHQSLIEDMIPNEEEKLKKDMPMPPPQAEVRQVEPPLVTNPTIRFYKGPDIKVVKNVISQIESSGGKFREHPEVKVGVHAGTKAHSSYGLMPKLMQELAQKKKDFAKTPTGLKILASGSPEEVSNITADKKHDDEAMRHLWEYNQSRIKKFAPQGADMELLGAYAHRRGIKGTYDALQNGGLEAIHKDPYVSKFKQLRNKIKSMGKSLESDVIPGGLSDKKSDKDFDPKLVREGVKVELEHTQDPRIAKEIAMDHLVESPSYYKMLRKLESMMKAERRNGTVYPDKEGETHPIKSDRHAVKVDGRLVWAYRPEHAARMDANLARDVKDYSAYLSPEKKKLLNDLHNVVKNDPNRHVISNTGNSPAMRQRHFHSALRAQEGYSLNFDNGITISANRHSDSNKTNNQKDSWKFDETGLKYSGSEPISKSMGENNENTKRNRLDDRTGVQRVSGTNRASLAKSGRDLSRNGGDVLDGKREYVSSGSETENGRVVQAVRGGETSAPGKLQSAKQLKKSIEALEKNNDYRISHTAPSGDDGIGAMHDLKNTFPEDIYSHEAVKLYGHGRPDDIVSINAIHSARGNPGKKIKIYRAVPDKKSPGELIQKYQEHKKHVMKTGQIPKDAEGKWNNSSDYYDHISSKIDELLPRANEPKEQLNINPGDWVTTARGYAKDHGEAVHGKGNYKILAMTVPAGHLYTDGDIHEWGYNPSNPGPKGKLEKGMHGDWKKEGYKISHVSYPEAPHIIHIKAHKDGQLVGELHAKKRGDTAYSDIVHVDRSHRRKGIASAMYAHAEKNFNVKMTPASEGDQTEAGKKLWEGTRSSKPFGKSEELNKGSLQRKTPFNPKQVDKQQRNTVESWTEGEGTYDRDDIKPMSGNDRARALHKLHSMTQTRRNPQTGEREFLLHRGQTTRDLKEGGVGHSNGLSSFTPNLKTARNFATDSVYDIYDNLEDVVDHPKQWLSTDEAYDPIVEAKSKNLSRKDFLADLAVSKHIGHVYSTWVPESSIHHIPAQWGSLLRERKAPGVPTKHNRAGEKEVIIHTNGLKYETKHVNDIDKLLDQPKLNKALEIPQAMANTTADGLIYRPQTKYVRIKSEVAGTHPKTGQQLYHHVLKQVGHSGETKYHHILSTDTDGKNGIGALEASHMYYDNTPAIERSGVKQEHRSIGLGKMLYQKALEHHGKLKSDYSMSPSASSVWKKLGNTEGIDVKFGKEGTMEPHTAKLNKAEDESGMTKYDLGDGYSLHHTDRRHSPKEDGSGYEPTDRVSQPGYHDWIIKHSGNPVGHMQLTAEKNDQTHPNQMKVLLSGIARQHRGKGVGGKAYQQLANHYGTLMSDDSAVSEEAQSVWKKIGAKELPDLTTFQDPRYAKQGQGGQVKFNEELQKDVGRIKFNLPNDKREFNKIPDRPDQEVKNVQTPKQVELGLRQAAYPDRKAFSNNTTKAAIRMAHTTLNPEKGQVKGVNVPSTLGTGKAMSLGEHHPVTAEHEGFHYLMHQIRNRHGHEAGHRFINSALAMVHPEDLHSITGMLSGGVYKDDEYLPEEKLAHIRDVLTDKNTRDVFHAHHTEKYINGESSVGIQDATNRLKASWKAIRNMAKEVRPEHLENEDKMRMLANKHMPVYR